jgi:hypothetical protein
MIFSTKGTTLKNLRGLIKTAEIAPLFLFSLVDWLANRQKCLDDIVECLGEKLFIVRSSSHNEDGSKASNAGAFLSIQNIGLADLEVTIEKVIASFGKASDDDQILIQPMLGSVVRSGVAFSHDPNTCSPYRIINWSEGSDTSIVTGGMGGRVWQQAALSLCPPPPALSPIVSLLEELLLIFDSAPIDCEFAVTLDGESEVLWLLQVRPLILLDKPESDLSQFNRLENIQAKVERGIQPHPFLMGRRTVYGVMPDWNPAEIVGIRPKPLALSLYRELVTDSIWAYQRHNYGYRNLRSFPLMPHFYGLPYIDVRLSFNSFIPADLNEQLAARLVDYYIDRLLDEPKLHDKVEFEIVFSCYTLDLPKRLERLSEAGFSVEERLLIAESLRKLTNRIVHPNNGLWREDAAKIDVLKARREELYSSSTDLLGRIYWLLEDTKRYGTLPFAGLARAGFVAVQMLKSLVEIGIFTQDNYDSFLEGISTVSGQLARDRAVLDKTTFLSYYGHLRPGTYDILSARYDEDPSLYFDWDLRPPQPRASVPFSLNLTQMKQIAAYLEGHGLQPDPIGLLSFMQSAIELRESSKFSFTRNLSDVLSLVTELGNQYGYSREDLAYCDIAVFMELHIASVDAKDALMRSIEQGKARYEETKKISLPPLISKPEDIWAFEWPETEPNFITQKQVIAAVVGCNELDRLSGAIIAIPNADPGFDWLFAYPIAGLITAWGGANSHMAIRAGEIGLPAAIGAGEVLYRRWAGAKLLKLDCGGRHVQVLA